MLSDLPCRIRQTFWILTGSIPACGVYVCVQEWEQLSAHEYSCNKNWSPESQINASGVQKNRRPAWEIKLNM